MSINTKACPIGVLVKRCFENIQQIYRGTLSQEISIKFQRKFIEITLRHWCSLINLLCIIRTPFPASVNTSCLLKTYGFSVGLFD